MIHIILPVHNRASITQNFLDCLISQTFQNYRLLLINDGCLDDTVFRARCAIPDKDRLVVLEGDGNLWWAGSLQLAHDFIIKEKTLDKDLILIINDDVTFDNNFLQNGINLAKCHLIDAIQAMGIDKITGMIDGGVVVNLSRLRFWPASSQQPANCLSTRGLLMSVKIFKESGGFRPKLLPHYLSDYEYTIRLKREFGVGLISSNQFSLKFNSELAGMAKYSIDTPKVFLNKTFSNRAKYNPIHWTYFVIMVCPLWVMPIHIARIWLRFLISTLMSILYGLKKYSLSLLNNPK